MTKVDNILELIREIGGVFAAAKARRHALTEFHSLKRVEMLDALQSMDPKRIEDARMAYIESFTASVDDMIANWSKANELANTLAQMSKSQN